MPSTRGGQSTGSVAFLQVIPVQIKIKSFPKVPENLSNSFHKNVLNSKLRTTLIFAVLKFRQLSDDEQEVDDGKVRQALCGDVDL